MRELREKAADSSPVMDPNMDTLPKVAIGPDQHFTCPYCGQCSIVD
jgi:hypothetical protein